MDSHPAPPFRLSAFLAAGLVCGTVLLVLLTVIGLVTLSLRPALSLVALTAALPLLMASSRRYHGERPRWRFGLRVFSSFVALIVPLAGAAYWLGRREGAGVLVMVLELLLAFQATEELVPDSVYHSWWAAFR